MDTNDGKCAALDFFSIRTNRNMLPLIYLLGIGIGYYSKMKKSALFTDVTSNIIPYFATDKAFYFLQFPLELLHFRVNKCHLQVT